ncbi:MAG: DNA polymerase I [Eubacteriales bacterium]|nr:DNA polymerase I [Eubacteriales bacterium]
MKDKLLLIDGHSILSRAFYGIPMLTNTEGTHTNAVYGFLNIMFKVIDEEGADHLAVAFDLSRHTFRTDIYEAYKGTRKPMPEELREQVPLIQEVLSAMNIPILTLENYEADDILGTVAKRSQKEGVSVTVLSGDRDLLQLADADIKITIPKTSRGRTEVFHYYPEDVKNEYGVTPLEFIDMKALMGDASDNIPGVPSIGEKTARAIIEQYHSIENAHAHVQEIRPPRAQKALSEHYDMAELSKTLATIITDTPIAFTFADAAVSDMYNEKALELIKKLEFKTIAARFAKAGELRTKETLSIPEPKVVRDKFLAGIALKDAVSEKQIGFCLYENGETAAAGLCLSGDRLYVILSSERYPAQELKNDLSEMLSASGKAGARIYTITLKRQLSGLSIRRSGALADLSIAAYLLNPLKDSYDYEDIARDYLGAALSSREELLGKHTVLDAAFSEELFGNAVKSIGTEAAVSFQAGKPLMKRLKDEGMAKLFEEVEMPLIYSLRDMEREGIRIDKAALDAYASDLKEKIDAICAEIFSETGEEFNLNSPQQLGVILFEKMGIRGGRKTKTGYSTAADVLQKLAPDYPVVNKILRYRALSKLYSTYAVGLSAFIRKDGRIHGTFNQTITATGRISSTEPNLQNIPVRTAEGKEIRKVFIPAEGCTFVDADYSQVELRILAALSGDEKLISAYRDAVDVHSLTASEVFHVPLSEVTPEMRRNAKAVNFGIVYGISAFGLGEGLSIGRKEAQEYIDRYFSTYPGVKKYLDEQVALAKEQGFVRTYFGRIRPIPEIRSSNFMQRSFGERVAMNSPIQGTAADIMKIAMNRVNMALSGLNSDGEAIQKPMKSRIVLQIHDELLIETVPEELAEVRQMVKDIMEHAAKLSVKLSVEAEAGDNWYDCH